MDSRNSFYYKPFEVRVFTYSTPRAFGESEHKPYGENLPWANYAGITNGHCVAFVIKKPRRELHLYADDKCSEKEMMETIGHELGHLMPNFQFYWDDERKAMTYEHFVGHVYEVNRLIRDYYGQP